MAKKFEVTLTVPEGLQAGDEFTILIELPEAKKRVQAERKPLPEMTIEEIRREITNASSLVSKARKTGKTDTESYALALARLEAATAERDSRQPELAAAVPTVTIVNTGDNSVYTNEAAIN